MFFFWSSLNLEASCVLFLKKFERISGLLYLVFEVVSKNLGDSFRLVFEVVWKHLGDPCGSCVWINLKQSCERLFFVFEVVWKIERILGIPCGFSFWSNLKESLGLLRFVFEVVWKNLGDLLCFVFEVVWLNFGDPRGPNFLSNLKESWRPL